MRLRLFSILLLLPLGSAQGYIDPGTGMTFAAGVGGLLMGFFTLVFGVLVMTFKKWIGKVRYFFALLASKFRKSKS